MGPEGAFAKLEVVAVVGPKFGDRCGVLRQLDS